MSFGGAVILSLINRRHKSKKKYTDKALLTVHGSKSYRLKFVTKVEN